MDLLSRPRWAVNPSLSRIRIEIYTDKIGDNWNSFGCDVSEILLLQTAQLIVDYGLKDLGYHYGRCWGRAIFLF